MNRRAFLQGMLTAAAAAALPTIRAKADALPIGKLGTYEGVRIIESPLFIGLDVAQGEDAAVAVLMRQTAGGVEVLEHARLETPVSQEQVTAWVRGLAEPNNVRRIIVHSPRRGEMEAWRNSDERRARLERVFREALWLGDATPTVKLNRETLVPRREQLRALMRQRSSGWGGARGSLVDLWNGLA